jgi:hypothetical protein
MARLNTVIAISATLMIVGCASQNGGQVYVFHGPDQVLEQFVAASQTCGYPHIAKMLGSHIEPVVLLDVPSSRTAEFECAWSWAKTHGLMTAFSESY